MEASGESYTYLFSYSVLLWRAIRPPLFRRLNQFVVSLLQTLTLLPRVPGAATSQTVTHPHRRPGSASGSGDELGRENEPIHSGKSKSREVGPSDESQDPSRQQCKHTYTLSMGVIYRVVRGGSLHHVASRQTNPLVTTS